MLFLWDPNGFQAKNSPRHDECPWPLLVSVRVSFVEPFGNLLEAFERGRFQTP
jgi:hypothetical protein